VERGTEFPSPTYILPLPLGGGGLRWGRDFGFPPFMSNKIIILKTVLFLTLIPSISFAIETIYPWSQPTNLPEWVFAIINLFILLGGIAALLSLVVGGIQWISSGVAPEQKAKAKDRVTYAIVGLLLLLCFHLILNNINPDLVRIRISSSIGSSSFFYFPTDGTIVLFEEPDCNGYLSPSHPSNECDNDNYCETNYNSDFKCLEIQKGDKRCVDVTKEMVVLSVDENLGSDPGVEGWDNKASSFIFYGDQYRPRLCKDEGFKDCRITLNNNSDIPSNKCVNFGSANDEVDLPNELSAVEVSLKPEGAILYEEKNFGGNYQRFELGTNESQCWAGPEGLILIGENTASSIEVGRDYWAILCRDPKGDCGRGPNGFFWKGKPECRELPGDYNDKVSKICVTKQSPDTCGGVIIWDGNVGDFIPAGERYQLGRDTLVKNNELQEIYQYVGNCKVKIWENAGLGPQNDGTDRNCRSPESTSSPCCSAPGGHPCNDPCTEDEACCGREIEIDIVANADSWDARNRRYNCIVNLRSHQSRNCTCSASCCGNNICARHTCSPYKFVFPGGPDWCNQYNERCCCGRGPCRRLKCSGCRACHNDNCVGYHASCIQVTK